MAPETTIDAGPDTTLNPQFIGAPLAEILTPDGIVMQGDLTVAGAATFPEGLQHVEVMVRNLDSNLHWNPEIQAFQPEWLRFPVELTGPDQTDMDWTFTLSADQLEPGQYRIRAWAKGLGGEGDPRGAEINIEIR